MLYGGKTFGWYTHHILPLVYDDSLSYYENICKLMAAVKALADELKSLEEGKMSELIMQWLQNMLITNMYREEDKCIVLGLALVSESGDHVYNPASGTMYVK